MDGKTAPEELQQLRSQIDGIDDELMALLARRFEITRQVGRLKASRQMESLDAGREQEKLSHLRAQAEELALNPDFIYNLFELLFAEVVSNHRRLRDEHGT